MESLLSISSMPFPYPNASESLGFRCLLSINTRRSVTVASRKAKKLSKEDKKDLRAGIDPSTRIFPEAVLLKEKKVQEDGRVRPDFKDDEEEKLYEFLNLQLESELNVAQMRHYEVVYVVHEKFEDEFQAVHEKVLDFIKEKKGKIWRENDWGMRRLAYKIQKATRAHYMLMNIEMDAKWINDLKNMLDEDERVIRHMTLKMDKAETEDCPPPPEYQTLSGGDMIDDDDDDDEDEDDEDYDDDDDDYDEEEDGEDDEEEESEWEGEEEEEEEEEEEGEEEEEEEEEGEGEGEGGEDEDGVVVLVNGDDEDESGTSGDKGKRREPRK